MKPRFRCLTYAVPWLEALGGIDGQVEPDSCANPVGDVYASAGYERLDVLHERQRHSGFTLSGSDPVDFSGFSENNSPLSLEGGWRNR